MKTYIIKNSGIKKLNIEGMAAIHRYNLSRCADRDINELIGLCKGVIADGSITDQETIFLSQWLVSHKEASDIWPANILVSRINTILKDNIVDDNEKNDLFKMLSDISGGVDPLPERYYDKSINIAYDDPLPPISFVNKSFCLTGDFCYGPRSKCEDQILHRGGSVKKNVSLSLDYLIVGTFGSTEWIHTSYGRKIEGAIGLKKTGKSHVAIVPEEHWAAAL